MSTMLTLLLDNVRSAYNVGSIFRTADAFGVSSLLLSGITCAPSTASVQIHKTALGAELSVPWKHIKDEEEAVALLRRMRTEEGFTIVGLEQSPRSVKLPLSPGQAFGERVVLIAGNEVRGVSERLLSECDAIIEIPQTGIKQSLNVSVAVAIALYELSRGQGR